MQKIITGLGFVLRNDSCEHSSVVFEAGNIAENRKILGMSQRELAECLGVSIHTIQSWEQDKRKPSQLAVKFMNFLLAKK